MSTRPPKAGLAFAWDPRSVRGKTAACLAYSVLLPAGFQFHHGGVLPGIRGSEDADQLKEGFMALLAWRRNGRLGVTTFIDQRAPDPSRSSRSRSPRAAG